MQVVINAIPVRLSQQWSSPILTSHLTKQCHYTLVVGLLVTKSVTVMSNSDPITQLPVTFAEAVKSCVPTGRYISYKQSQVFAVNVPLAR